MTGYLQENTDPNIKAKVIEAVNSIPKGSVASYGEVGSIAGCSGWIVGRILSGLPQSQWESVAWQRVVSKDGFISSLKLGFRGQLQKNLLESEGVTINSNLIDMHKFGAKLQKDSTLTPLI